MPPRCLPHVHACRMRVSRLDELGIPAPGANNLYVSDALVSLAFAWEVQTGEEIEFPSGCGANIPPYKAPDSLKRGNVTITLRTPDPQLSEMLGQGTVLTDGDAYGYASPNLGPIGDTVLGIEVWAKQINNGKLDTTFPYAWWIYPWITNLRPGDHTHEQANLGSVFIGEAYENENWFDGPLNDWPSTSDSPYQWIETTAMPEASCGYLTLASS